MSARHAAAWKSASPNMRPAPSTATPARRQPITLVFHQHFERVEDAVAAERHVKGWRREKKAALIRGDFAALRSLSRRTARPPVVLRDGVLPTPPQHERQI